jgi:hypothetical protein
MGLKRFATPTVKFVNVLIRGWSCLVYQDRADMMNHDQRKGPRLPSVEAIGDGFVCQQTKVSKMCSELVKNQLPQL